MEEKRRINRNFGHPLTFNMFLVKILKKKEKFYIVLRDSLLEILLESQGKKECQFNKRKMSSLIRCPRKISNSFNMIKIY